MSILDIYPQTRADRRRAQTHELLKQAAADVLAEVGYQNLTIKAITERADVGYGTFYLHFPDKDEIVWAVIYDIAEELRQRVDALVADVPFPRREFLSWIEIFRFVESNKQGFADFFGSGGSSKLLQRYQDYVAAVHERNLRAGVYSSGLDLPPDFLAQFITGALVRLLLWWAQTPNGHTPETMARMVYEAVYRQPAPQL